MTDADLLALNAYEEASGEPDDGVAGVARVTLNRKKRPYFSDTTMIGTVLCKDQFSWAWFAFEPTVKHTGTATHTHSPESYVRVCSTEAQAIARAQDMLSKVNTAAFARCGSICAAVVAGTYRGPAYDALDDDALLYLNPAILRPPLPAWVVPAKFETRIGHHDFYRA